jgi:hypothetical protein
VDVSRMSHPHHLAVKSGDLSQTIISRGTGADKPWF